MRLPRRVPWGYISELEQVCLWIYADEDDFETKILAINRLSAWKAVTALPQALDSALDILAARMLDASCRDDFSTTTLSLRHAYATAIIRMVNGLVDPLQSGAYARSIASIASQLGLPSWLVELRHSATHEDLPSVQLLREASKESLSWLLSNYFHPTINPALPASTRTSSLPLRSVTPLLKSYKILMKTLARDVSLSKQYQGEIDAVMRSVQRWITEAKVSVELATNPLGWGFDDHSVTTQIDPREKWALELFCDAIIERGFIVPVSKRKCHAPVDPFLPTATSLALWTPLLVQIYETHPSFSSVFLNRAISVLLNESAEPEMNMNVAESGSQGMPVSLTHKEYLARWVSWAAQTWADESDHGADLRKDIILQFAPIFVPGHSYVLNERIITELLHAISNGRKDLEECVELLRFAIATVPAQAQPWKAHDLLNMEERLQMLRADKFQTSDPHENGSAETNNATPAGLRSAVGWRLLDSHSKWRPCPIGVYYFDE